MVVGVRYEMMVLFDAFDDLIRHCLWYVEAQDEIVVETEIRFLDSEDAAADVQ